MHQRYLLHCASQSHPSGKREIIECLVEQNPSTAYATGSFGKLPLHVACENAASREAVEALFDRRGGNHSGLGMKGNHGRAPLHCLRWLSMDAFELLLERCPAAASITNNDGALPLLDDAARCGCNSNLVCLLLEANPLSVLKMTRRGLTPLQIELASRALCCPTTASLSASCSATTLEAPMTVCTFSEENVNGLNESTCPG